MAVQHSYTIYRDYQCTPADTDPGENRKHFGKTGQCMTMDGIYHSSKPRVQTLSVRQLLRQRQRLEMNSGEQRRRESANKFAIFDRECTPMNDVHPIPNPRVAGSNPISP